MAEQINKDTEHPGMCPVCKLSVRCRYCGDGWFTAGYDAIEGRDGSHYCHDCSKLAKVIREWRRNAEKPQLPALLAAIDTDPDFGGAE